MDKLNAKIQIPIITVDGPSGVGKGTLSQLLAKHFGFELLDSGAIYRLLALQLVEKDLLTASDDVLAKEAGALDVIFQSTDAGIHIFLNNRNVTDEVRLESTGIAASKIAAIPAVRAALLQRQKDFAQMPGLVADGRDMGTIVFPNAVAKLFIDASSEARANRRIAQLKAAGKPYDPDLVLQDIIERDKRDRERTVAPLVAADDAFVIDTTSLSIQEVFDKAIEFVTKQLQHI